MLMFEILRHTPFWVWGTLMLLVWLGLAQSVARQVTLRRVIVLPLGMTALSLHGTFAVFDAAYWSWALWLGAAALAVAWFASSELPVGVRYDAPTRSFHVPGRWEPLVLMMLIFCTRYVVGVVLALHPELTRDPAAAAMVASIYGALSSVFIGRMVRMLRSARSSESKPADKARIAWG